MKLYLSLDCVSELDAIPRTERKTAWKQAWKEARKKDRRIWLGPVISGSGVAITMIVLQHVPPPIVNAAAGGLLGGLLMQQLYYRIVIPYIKK